MYQVCSFAAGQLIVDVQAQAYTCEHLLPHSVCFTRPTVRVQFVDLRYRNTTEEKMASISIKGIASHWN